MKMLRVLPLALGWGLFSIPALAELTTVGPDTPGVTESVFTLVPVSPQTSPLFFVPQFTPLPAGQFGGGYMIGPAVLITLGPGASGCLAGCSGKASVPQTFRMLDISFSQPVSFVSAVQTSVPFKDALIIAYDSAGQEVGICDAAAGSAVTPGSCYSVLSNSNNSALVRYTISNSSADISTLLVGGDIFDPINKVESVQFSAKSVPEPGTFSLFALALGLFGMANARKLSRRRRA